MKSKLPWNGLCPAGLHGLDHQAQECDTCAQNQITIARRLGATLERYATDESLAARHKLWAGGDPAPDRVLVYLWAYQGDAGEAGEFKTEGAAALGYLQALGVDLTASEQLAQVRAEVQIWADKQGHERCHWYPEIFGKIAQILGVVSTVDPALPPRPEFEAGCKRFQDQEYSALSGPGLSSEELKKLQGF